MEGKMKTTQGEKVYRHLKYFGKITPMEAIHEYGITRLSAVVFNLKKRGIPIESEIETGRNRFGEKAWWSKYTLETNS